MAWPKVLFFLLGGVEVCWVFGLGELARQDGLLQVLIRIVGARAGREFKPKAERKFLSGRRAINANRGDRF